MGEVTGDQASGEVREAWWRRRCDLMRTKTNTSIFIQVYSYSAMIHSRTSTGRSFLVTCFPFLERWCFCYDSRIQR